MVAVVAEVYVVEEYLFLFLLLFSPGSPSTFGLLGDFISILNLLGSGRPLPNMVQERKRREIEMEGRRGWQGRQKWISIRNRRSRSRGADVGRAVSWILATGNLPLEVW